MQIFHFFCFYFFANWKNFIYLNCVCVVVFCFWFVLFLVEIVLMLASCCVLCVCVCVVSVCKYVNDNLKPIVIAYKCVSFSIILWANMSTICECGAGSCKKQNTKYTGIKIFVHLVCCLFFCLR